MTAELPKTDFVKQADCLRVFDDAADAAPVKTATAPVVAYSVTDAWIEKAKSDYSGLKITDAKSDASVRAARTTMVRARTTIDKERKIQNELAQKHIAHVNEKARDIIAKMRPLEDELQAECDRADEERARLKREKEEAERKAIEDAIRKKQEEEEAAAKAIRDAEEKRLAEEKAALDKAKEEFARQKAEADAKRAEQERIEREREEAARKERERIEAERQAEERRRWEAEQKEARERQAKIDAEQKAERDRLAAEKAAIEAAQEAERVALRLEAKRIEEARLKAELEEAERQAKIRAEQEAKELAQQQAREAAERQAAEEFRKAEHARKMEALKPDREKLKTFAAAIRGLKPPVVKSDDAVAVLANAMKQVAAAAEYLEDFASEPGIDPHLIA